MSRADYLEGLAVATLLLGLVLAAAAIALRRGLPRLTGAARWTAFGLLGTLALVVAHVLPLALGVLTRGTVLAAAAALAGAATRVPRPADARSSGGGSAATSAAGSDVPGARVAARAPRPLARTGSLSALIAVAAVAAVAATALAVAARDATRASAGLDMVNFHLPEVARWIQSGSLWEIGQFVPGLTHGNYPNNGDAVLLASVLPWRNDFAARLSMLPFLALAGLATFALARELRAPAGAAALAGALVCAVPIVGQSAVADALPDPVMWATFAAGLLFLVRYARYGAGGELALAGIGLGLAFGAKWYGVWAAAIGVAVWAGGSLAARGGLARVARDAGVLAAIVALTGGVWLVRNWVESGNPVFPVKVEVLGLTVLDAPPDRLREQSGFTVAGYAGDGEVWGERLLPTYRDFLGAPALAVLLGGLAGVGLAAARLLRPRSRPLMGAGRRGEGGAGRRGEGGAGRRGEGGAEVAAGPGGSRGAAVGSGPEGVVVGLGVAGLLLALAYALTPYSAQGAAGQPVFAGPNTRYLVPALLALAPVGAYALGRLARRSRALAHAAEVAALAAVVLGLREAFDVDAVRLIAWAVTLALVAGGVAAARALRLPGRRLAAAGGIGVAVAIAAAVGWREQERFDEDRYRGVDATFDWVLAHAPEGRRIALAGDWSNGIGPPFPMFGPRLRNEVAYNGPWVREMLQRHRGPRPFLVGLRDGDYDLLLVGRGFLAAPGAPPAHDVLEERWARAAGLRQLARSDTLTLFAVR